MTVREEGVALEGGQGAVLMVHGIPSCDTCKRALRALTAGGMAHVWVDLREQPPDEATVRGWVQAVGSAPLRNTSGQRYRALGPEKATWSEEAWVSAFAADPMLLKRPIFTWGDRVLQVGARGSPEALCAHLAAAIAAAGPDRRR